MPHTWSTVGTHILALLSGGYEGIKDAKQATKSASQAILQCAVSANRNDQDVCTDLWPSIDVPNENSSRKEFYRAAGAAAFVERRHTLVLISNDSWLLGEMANAT